MNADAGRLIEVQRDSLAQWCIRAMHQHRAMRLALQRCPQIQVSRPPASLRSLRRSSVRRPCNNAAPRPLAS